MPPTRAAVVFAALLAATAVVAAQSTPLQRYGALPAPLPPFPADNWWNQDISQTPVDPASASQIAFINNGGTRRLHPDFGGYSGVGDGIYGFPYVAVISRSGPCSSPCEREGRKRSGEPVGEQRRITAGRSPALWPGEFSANPDVKVRYGLFR